MKHILRIALAGTAVFVLCLASHAHAAPLADDPLAGISRVEELIRGGQVAQAVLVGTFLALFIASRHVAWLQVGYRALYIGAAVSAFTAIAEAAARGSTPTLGTAISAALQFVGQIIAANAPARLAAGLMPGAALTSPAPLPRAVAVPPKNDAS